MLWKIYFVKSVFHKHTHTNYYNLKIMRVTRRNSLMPEANTALIPKLSFFELVYLAGLWENNELMNLNVLYDLSCQERLYGWDLLHYISTLKSSK